MNRNTALATLNSAVEQFNRGDLEGYLSTLYDEDAALHFLPPALPQGHAGARLFYSGFLQGFPDAALQIDDVIVDGDRLAARYSLVMTHAGAFNGIPATNQRVTLQGITVMRWANGRVVERWSEAGFLDLLTQLGAVPAPSS